MLAIKCLRKVTLPSLRLALVVALRLIGSFNSIPTTCFIWFPDINVSRLFICWCRYIFSSFIYWLGVNIE